MSPLADSDDQVLDQLQHALRVLENLRDYRGEAAVLTLARIAVPRLAPSPFAYPSAGLPYRDALLDLMAGLAHFKLDGTPASRVRLADAYATATLLFESEGLVPDTQEVTA